METTTGRAPSSPLRLSPTGSTTTIAFYEVIAAGAEADSNMGTYFVDLSRLSRSCVSRTRAFACIDSPARIPPTSIRRYSARCCGVL